MMLSFVQPLHLAYFSTIEMFLLIYPSFLTFGEKYDDDGDWDYNLGEVFFFFCQLMCTKP